MVTPTTRQSGATVSILVDGEKLRAGEAPQSPGEGGVGVLGGELVEHVRSHGESGGEAVEHGVVDLRVASLRQVIGLAGLGDRLHTGIGDRLHRNTQI